MSASNNHGDAHTAEIDMADSVEASDIDTILTNVTWAIRSTYHSVLKASPGAEFFWLGHAVRHSLPSSLEQNRRLQAMPDRSQYQP